MANRIEYSLNKENLFELGVEEEHFYTYQKIIEIYNNKAEDYIKHGYWGFFSKGLDAGCAKKVKPVLDDYFEKFSYIYANGYRMHVNNFGLRYFTLFRWIKNPLRSYGFEYRLDSYEDFLSSLERLAVRLIYRHYHPDKEFDNQKLSLLHDEINAHINKLVWREKKDRIRPADQIPSADDLYIYDNLFLTACYKGKHNVVPETYYAELKWRSDKIKLPVHCCLDCGKYFIGRKTYNYFTSIYEITGNIINPLSIEAYDKFDEFKSESKLHRLGYSVRMGGRGERERQEFLIGLLIDHKITYQEMAATIEQDIRMFEHNDRYWQAVQKWKRDLVFIGNWVKENKDKLKPKWYKTY